MQDMICGAVSWPNPVVPMNEAPVCYTFSIAYSSMAIRASSKFSKVSRLSFSACYFFYPMRCSVSVKAFTGILKKDPKYGASILHRLT